MTNTYHEGPWFVDKKPATRAGSGFNVRAGDRHNPSSFRTYNDSTGKLARRIVRLLEQDERAAPIEPEIIVNAAHLLLAIHTKVHNLPLTDAEAKSLRAALSSIGA